MAITPPRRTVAVAASIRAGSGNHREKLHPFLPAVPDDEHSVVLPSPSTQGPSSFSLTVLFFFSSRALGRTAAMRIGGFATNGRTRRRIIIIRN
ncbi:hypothetical protein PIB30_098580, partial [Stylosanthes scabra]|nr:hypothetical protein [Stylosanthes scabra]